MSKKLVNSKGILFFTFLCCMVYGVSYVTRINFTAMISEIIKVEGITKTAASFVTTSLFVAYGAGQLIFGAIGDRVDAKKFIFIGLFVSSVLNFLMPFTGNIYIMSAIWFLNGFAQAIMWPSLAKITADYLSLEGYKKICVSIAISSSAATIGIYILVPALLMVLPYKMIFVICGGIGVVASAIWAFKIGDVEKQREDVCEEMGNSTSTGARESSVFGKPLIISMIFIGIAICIQGILKDGITTWTPSYIQEIFNFPPSFSILITVILPLFSIISIKLAGFIHAKFIKNEILCAGAFFAAAAIAAAIMSQLYNLSSVLCVLLAAIITGCMHGINLMLICMVPGRFEKYGLVATMSGMLNFISYIGSSASTYLIARFAEVSGWQATVLLWAVLAGVGILICILFSKTFAQKKDA